MSNECPVSPMDLSREQLEGGLQTLLIHDPFFNTPLGVTNMSYG